MKKNNCAKAKNAEDCALSCEYCEAAGGSSCDDSLEDKKGSKWCVKKAKSAKKWSKLCTSSKAKKCESTCCDNPYD